MIIFLLFLMMEPSLPLNLKVVQGQCTSIYCETWRTPKPNMEAAMLGYNPLLGNRLIDGQSDPGMRDQIFEPTTISNTSKILLASNIHVYDSENCQVHGQTSVVNNYEEYRSKQVNHVTSNEEHQDTFSANIPIKSFMVNFEATQKRSNSKSNDYEKETKFFSETSGEIYFNEVHCEVYNIIVSQFEKPIFTSAFISAMQALNKAAKNPNAASSKQTVKKFINTFGTHYQSESWLGASLTIETRSTSQSEGEEEMQIRSECIKDAYESAISVGATGRQVGRKIERTSGKNKEEESYTTGGWSLGAERSYKRESNNCFSNENDSSFFFKNEFSQTKITSRGAPPVQDINQWAQIINESPSVIRLNILPIKNLFTTDWIGSIPASNDETVDEQLDAERMYNYFDNAVKNYCQTMLDRECDTAKGCGINSNCTYSEKCENDNSDLGFKCVPLTVINGGWSSWSIGRCSKTCGGGTKRQTRSCTNPRPRNGGAPCDGSRTRSVNCNTDPCPVKPSELGTCFASFNLLHGCENDGDNFCKHGAIPRNWFEGGQCCCNCVKDGVRGEKSGC